MAFVALSVALKKLAEAEYGDIATGKEAVDMFSNLVALRRSVFHPPNRADTEQHTDLTYFSVC